MYDTAVVNGVVVGSLTQRRVNLGVRGGRIAAIVEPDGPLPATETIDATGLMVLPGLVDAHVHFREPGLAHKEGFETGTQAAAAGGVTTVMVMPTDKPLTLTPADFEDKVRMGEGKSYVDFALQAALGPDVSHVEELARLGAVSFEIFLAGFPPPLLMTNTADLVRALHRVRAVGSVAGISPGDDSVVSARTSDLLAAGRRDPRAFAESGPPVAEALGVARACLAARESGARVHLRQISCAASVGVLRALRPACPGLSAEVTPHNLVLDEGELERLGPIAKVWPPLRERADLEVVRSALAQGLIDIVATDHAPHLPAEKEAGRADIWKAPGGFPGLQTLLPVMLEQVASGWLSWSDLVRWCAETPARLFGLFPRKGVLDPGADADLVLVDPNGMMVIEDATQYSKARLTPFNGMRVRGRPVLAMLRGRVMMREGRVEGRPGGMCLQRSR